VTTNADFKDEMEEEVDVKEPFYCSPKSSSQKFRHREVERE